LSGPHWQNLGATTAEQLSNVKLRMKDLISVMAHDSIWLEDLKNSASTFRESTTARAKAEVEAYVQGVVAEYGQLTQQMGTIAKAIGPDAAGSQGLQQVVASPSDLDELWKLLRYTINNMTQEARERLQRGLANPAERQAALLHIAQEMHKVLQRFGEEAEYANVLLPEQLLPTIDNLVGRLRFDGAEGEAQQATGGARRGVRMTQRRMTQRRKTRRKRVTEGRRVSRRTK
jgi:hypothetical protein